MKDDQIIYMADTLAFAFTWEREGAILSTLQKHGPLDRVEEYARKFKEKLKASDNELAHEIADSLVIISSTEWDIEEIQKFIDISGYIGIWYQNNHTLKVSHDNIS